MTALDWMMRAYPDVKEREDMRRIIGRYGLTGLQQVTNSRYGLTGLQQVHCSDYSQRRSRINCVVLVQKNGNQFGGCLSFNGTSII